MKSNHARTTRLLAPAGSKVWTESKEDKTRAVEETNINFGDSTNHSHNVKEVVENREDPNHCGTKKRLPFTVASLWEAPGDHEKDHPEGVRSSPNAPFAVRSAV